MSDPVRSLDDLDRCGNAPCLDFVNTVHSRVEAGAHDYLGTYADLVDWARGGDLLEPQEARRLLSAARSRTRAALKALGQAISLRETLYRLFVSVVHGDALPARDLDEVNRWLGRALSRRRLVGGKEGPLWGWDPDPEALERPLWPIVQSAAELLVDGDQTRLDECPPPEGCGWLFLDRSKNGTRRWCNMRTCGNLAKARRHYRRRSSG